MADSPKENIESLVDLAVRAPIGFLYGLLDQYPDAVKRGKSQTDVGLASLKSLADSTSKDLSDISGEAISQAASCLRAIADRLDEINITSDSSPAEGPLANYDDLTAKQVVEAASSADSSTISAIYAYESANKRRKSVLAATKPSDG